MNDENLIAANKPAGETTADRMAERTKLLRDLLPKMSGRLIAVDGIDGAGKSTQVAVLAGQLKVALLDLVEQDLDGPLSAINVQTLREPGGTYFGEKIRQVLLDGTRAEDDGEFLTVNAETLLFMASRAQLVTEKVVPLTDDGHVVLCDRWASTTYAYQSTARRAVPWDVVDALYRFVAPFPQCRPDPLVVLDLPADLAAARMTASGRRKDRFETLGVRFFEDARDGFLQFAHEHARRSVVVDASGTPEQTTDRVLSALAGYYNIR